MLKKYFYFRWLDLTASKSSTLLDLLLCSEFQPSLNGSLGCQILQNRRAGELIICNPEFVISYFLIYFYIPNKGIVVVPAILRLKTFFIYLIYHHIPNTHIARSLEVMQCNFTLHKALHNVPKWTTFSIHQKMLPKHLNVIVVFFSKITHKSKI